MAATHEEIVISYYCDLLAHGEREAADEVLAPDFIDHGYRTDRDSRGAFLHRLEVVHAAFQSRLVIIEDVDVSGENVLVRWSAGLKHTGEFLGLDPTGKQIDVSGADVFRIEGGSIVERWNHESGLGLIDALHLRAALAGLEQPDVESFAGREPAVGAAH